MDDENSDWASETLIDVLSPIYIYKDVGTLEVIRLASI
jgi:hypothetical protein